MAIHNPYTVKQIYYYYLIDIYGKDVHKGLPEYQSTMFHFEFDTCTVYLKAPDEFIARIALLDLGYDIIKEPVNKFTHDYN